MTSLPTQRPADARVLERLRRLEAVTDLALARLGFSELLDELLDRVRDLLETDTAAVLLLDESGEFLVATAARGIEEEVRQGSRVPVGIGFAGRIAAERRPVVIDEVSPATVVNPLLLYKGVKSMLGVPMVGEDGVLGVLHVGTLTPRVFTEEDSELLEKVAERCAQALQAERARLDSLAATAFQRSVAPGRLPEPVGLELSARYVPGSRAGVGGDWYDGFSLPDGRLALVIGDVMGHGLRAATVMARIRAALRGFALTGDDPAEVLARLDQYLQHFEPGQMASVLYAIQTPGTSRVVFSSAGHMPPALARPNAGAVLLEESDDLMLGIEPESPRSSHQVEVPPGSLLCLYTDGLIEGRGRNVTGALDQLCQVLAAARGPAESITAYVMAEMVAEDRHDDDVALLLVKRTR